MKEIMDGNSRFAIMLTRIVIIGDGQVESAFRTFGFASKLSDRYNGEADIILRKFPGYTSEWVSLVASSTARNLSGNCPDYVIVLLGQDDCLRREEDKRPLITPDQFGKNVVKIISKITNEVDVKPENVIIVSPVPIHQKRFESNKSFAGLSADSQMLEIYTQKAKEAAKRVAGRFVNTTSLFSHDMDGYLDRDGYKLTPEGHTAIADKLHDLIEIAPPAYPAYNEVGSDFQAELDSVAKRQSLKQPPNISAYTYVSTVDEYSAFFKKTYRGQV